MKHSFDEANGFRSSSPEVFYEIGVLKNFAKFTWKHLCQSLFFNKVAGLMPATLLKKRPLQSCNFYKLVIWLPWKSNISPSGFLTGSESDHPGLVKNSTIVTIKAVIITSCELWISSFYPFTCFVYTRCISPNDVSSSPVHVIIILTYKKETL